MGGVGDLRGLAGLWRGVWGVRGGGGIDDMSKGFRRARGWLVGEKKQAQKNPLFRAGLFDSLGGGLFTRLQSGRKHTRFAFPSRNKTKHFPNLRNNPQHAIRS